MDKAVWNTIKSVARRHNGQKVYPAKKKHLCYSCYQEKALGFWEDGEFLCRVCAREQEKSDSDSDREPTAAEIRREWERHDEIRDMNARYQKALNEYNERNADAIQTLIRVREEQRLKRAAFIASGGDKDEAWRRFPSPEYADYVKEKMPQPS